MHMTGLIDGVFGCYIPLMAIEHNVKKGAY
jgi:hypothetical protein